MELKSLFEAEREAVQMALAVHGKNRRVAASVLGISRASLYRLIKKHGLNGGH